MRSRLSLFFLILLLCSAYVNAQDQGASQDATQSQYIIEDALIKTRNKGEISVLIVRPLAEKDGAQAAKPVILQYTIYVRDQGRDLITAKEIADRGYVSVVAYSRGKRFSSNEIFPYEHDATDAHDVIDWISKQAWCDGQVGMFGGSYNGFTQWAATKSLHPALKTIVPYVAAGPGMGWPMENNIFINPNYSWSFFVGNNKSLDHDTYANKQRFRDLQNRWWNSGAAYKEMDKLDGHPNKWFQKWIQHPSYDKYWQNLVPYQQEFSQIDIPVLSIDGYYNDSQVSGLHFLREHYKYRPDAQHYLIIGPYSHFGAQRGGERVVSGYTVDEDALIDTKEITFKWLDYILLDGPKPTILQGKINYQVMGLNQWRSADSIAGMSNTRLKLYLSDEKAGEFYSLSRDLPEEPGHLHQEVDLADRDAWTNDNYPDPIIKDEIDQSTGLNLVSEPFEEPTLISGSFAGEIHARINKKDFDLGVTLYEVTPDNQYFHLSYFVGRASFAKDRTTRTLLTPGKIETIPFSNTRLICKRIRKGSRLLVHLNVNKNPFSQLNYGTGKDVSEETINDAGAPLKVDWYNSSFVEIPIWIER